MAYTEELRNIKSTVNSSTSALTAGSTFTGTGELNDLSDVMINVSTDQNGVLYVEFSQDGTNWDTSLSFQYNIDRINPPHIFVKGVRYYRTRFENTSLVNQTYLRLETAYGDFKKLTAPINGILAENYDAIVVRPTDYKSEVAMGERQGRKVWNKFGFNNEIDTGTSDIIASWQGVFDPTTDVMTTAQTFDITYNNATDGESSTGATGLMITYIDEDFLDQESIHILGSTGSDTTSFSGLGINRVVLISNGGIGYNNNDITFKATTDGTTQAQIPAESSVTQQCLFHTQISHNFLIDWMLLNSLKDSGGGGNPKVTFKMYSWSRVTLTRYEIFRDIIDTADESNREINFGEKLTVGGREVVWLEASSTVNNLSVNARFSGIEERVK